MKKYLIGLLIVFAAGAALFMIFNQGLFTASDDAVEVADDSVEPVEEEDAVDEEEVVDDAPIEEVPVEESEPDGDEGDNATGDAEFTVTEFPFQDFNQARANGEPIVLKFYSET
jgi:hypothetical protein